MDSVITKSGTDSSNMFASPPSAPSSDIPSTSGESITNFLTVNGETDWVKIGLIIVVLLLLGVNVFSYLGDILDYLKDTFGPIIGDALGIFGYAVTEGTVETTKVAAKGAKLGIDVAAGTIESGVDVLQGQLDLDQSSKQQKEDSDIATSLNNNAPAKNDKKKESSSMPAALSNALSHADSNMVPMPDDAISSTQRSGGNKSGFCYIGEDRGFRSCIPVTEDDVCMSGDIFPSNELCVNPSLRD